MFKFWNSHEQQAQPPSQDGSSHSWYPPSPNSSRPATPSSSASNSFNSQRPVEWSHSPSPVSPAEAAGVIPLLKDKSVDELRKLLSDKDAYDQFLQSVDQVKIQNNGAKEPQIMELRNQCRIICTTELAAAQEKLKELEIQKEETMKFYSPASFMHRLQDAMNATEEESEIVNKQLLDGEIDIGTFVQKYKKHRSSYHQRALILLAAKTSPIG